MYNWWCIKIINLHFNMNFKKFILNSILEILIGLLQSKWAATCQPTKWSVHPAKTQVSLGTHPVWSESSLSAWGSTGSLATQKVTVKTLIRLGWCPGWSESSLGAHASLLVLPCCGSNLLWRSILTDSSGQTVWTQVRRSSLNRFYTVCHSVCIFGHFTVC